MSRLYSSPEVSSLGCLLWVFALGCLPWNVPSLGLRLSWSLGVSSRLGIKSFGYKVALVQSRSGPILGPIRHTPHAHRITVQSDSTTLSPYVAVEKDALPNSPAQIAGGLKSFRLPKQAQVFREIFQAQYQAFVRFAVGRGAALSSHRAQA